MSSSFMWGVLQNNEGENSLLLLLLSEEEEECMSCEAQCKCELPQEMVMIVCCPSGGAASGHFEVDEDDSAMMLLLDNTRHRWILIVGDSWLAMAMEQYLQWMDFGKDVSCENLKSACENLLRIRQFSLRFAATWRSRGGHGQN